MSEATCGGAQRNHTSVAGGDCTKSQKSLKSKDFSRRPIPLQSRESPVRIGPGTPCLTKAPNLSRIFSFMEAPHFREVAPGDRGPATHRSGDRGPASQDDAAAAPSLINSIALRSQTPLPLMSEATCGGAQRNHTSVAGGDFAKIQKSLKNKGFSRRPIPLKSRESPVRVNHTSVAGGDFTKSQKSLKRKGFSRRPIPLKSRESPVRVNHTSVAGGEFSERQKSLKSKNFSRRQIPLQSRESPVRSSIAPTPPVPIFNPGPRYFIAAPIALG